MEGKLPEVRLSNTPFQVVSPYEPAGDQPKAIAELAHGIEEACATKRFWASRARADVHYGETIEAVQKPTLVLAPLLKTLAAQLASELKEFFPNNSVVYFVSYYDYYQPEAYVPSSDTFIEKDAHQSEEFEKPCGTGRLAATARCRRELHLRHRQPDGLRGLAVFSTRRSLPSAMTSSTS